MVCLCLLVSTVHLDGFFVLKFVKLNFEAFNFMVTYAGSLSVHVVTSIGTKKGPKLMEALIISLSFVLCLKFRVIILLYTF